MMAAAMKNSCVKVRRNVPAAWTRGNVISNEMNRQIMAAGQRSGVMAQRFRVVFQAAVKPAQVDVKVRPRRPRNFDPARQPCLPASQQLLRPFGILIPERSIGHRPRGSKGWAKSVRRCEIGSLY